MILGELRVRVVCVALLAAILAGCGANLGSTTYDPRRACEAFGGKYWETEGTCHAGNR